MRREPNERLTTLALEEGFQGNSSVDAMWGRGPARGVMFGLQGEASDPKALCRPASHPSANFPQANQTEHFAMKHARELSWLGKTREPALLHQTYRIRPVGARLQE
jgi:hypothetical protein